MDSKNATLPYVTPDHCNQVSLRIEGKVDLNTAATHRLADKLDPKIDMIVSVHTSLKWIKGIALFVCSGGFITAVYKAFVYFSSKR